MKALFSWAQLTAGHLPVAGHDRGLHQGVLHGVKQERKLQPPFPQMA
jgi:hypothetical protein